MAVGDPAKIEKRVLKGIGRLGPARREKAMEFHNTQIRNGVSASTRNNYLHLWNTLEYIGKPYEEMTDKDLEDWLTRVIAKYAPMTVEGMKGMVRKYFQWVHNGVRVKKGVYPPVVDWIQHNSKISQKRLPRALSKADVVNLVRAAGNERDRALFFVTYDSGGRASEVINLKVGDIIPDEYGFRVILRGKTGERLARLLDSVPDLQRWLNVHPYGNDMKAPLWPSRKGSMTLPLGYNHANDLLKRAAKRAGIEGQLSFHTLRHSRATHLANKHPEAILRSIFGWTPTSKMPAVYVHLSGRDIDRAQLEAAGIEVKGAKEEDRATRPKTCPRCRIDNGAATRFCGNCGLILDQELAIQMSADTAQIKTVGLEALHKGGLDKAFENPETALLMEALLERLKADI